MATKGQKQFGDAILNDALKMKAEGKTNREISEFYGFKNKYVIKNLISRYHRKQKKIEAGIMILPKGRPRKSSELNMEQKKDNEIKQLKMENTLLRSFLQIVGRM
jgi:hypothetical protein